MKYRENPFAATKIQTGFIPVLIFVLGFGHWHRGLPRSKKADKLSIFYIILHTDYTPVYMEYSFYLTKNNSVAVFNALATCAFLTRPPISFNSNGICVPNSLVNSCLENPALYSVPKLFTSSLSC